MLALTLVLAVACSLLAAGSAWLWRRAEAAPQSARTAAWARAGVDAVAASLLVAPVLGNYPNTTVSLGANATVTPDAAPTNATSINVSTSTDFKGTFAADPTTGVVRVTNAHPAGTYTVKVLAFDSGGASDTKTFQLTVEAGTACASAVAFTNAADASVGNGPYSVAVGDFNSDGKQDIAAANNGSNNVSIRLGACDPPPTVTINQAATQADPTSSSPINFTVVFSESVSDFATGDVTLSGTAGATTATVTGSGTTYNVAVSGMTTSGTVIASIAAGVATDAAAKTNTASTSTDNTVTFEKPGFEFTQATYTVAERGGQVVITVRRLGDTSQAASVDYATDDGSTPSVVVPCSSTTGLALECCDYTRAAGTLRFAAGQTEQSFTVLVGDDAFVEGPETTRLRLSNPSAGATLGSRTVATLEITDDAVESAGNVNDDTASFVRQHYHDFLNREPDARGLEFWTNEIETCGADALCREVKRVNVSAAFFLSIEFKETGCLVYHFYTAALDRPDSLPGHAEFLRDTQAIQRGVIVGTDGWREKLEANKQAYAEGFVARPEFLALYPLTMSPGAYVDALFAHARLTPTAAEREAAVAEFGGASDISNVEARARALRRVAESEALHERDVNRAFVLMEYFGYLRRDPKAAPDTDLSGYNFWLAKLNAFNGDFLQAEMVKAFISSIEYRKRFAQ